MFPIFRTLELTNHKRKFHDFISNDSIALILNPTYQSIIPIQRATWITLSKRKKSSLNDQLLLLQLEAVLHRERFIWINMTQPLGYVWNKFIQSVFFHSSRQLSKLTRNFFFISCLKSLWISPLAYSVCSVSVPVWWWWLPCILRNTSIYTYYRSFVQLLCLSYSSQVLPPGKTSPSPSDLISSQPFKRLGNAPCSSSQASSLSICTKPWHQAISTILLLSVSNCSPWFENKFAQFSPEKPRTQPHLRQERNPFSNDESQ